ncbi:MAG TPA: O-antigen ligase family protein [Bacteroidales bacterium]
MFSEQLHKSVYFGALILLAVSLPFSVFTLSVAQIVLLVNWILEGRFRQKWELIIKQPSLWMIGIFYLVHILWMINTSNIAWGLHELKINLPLLVIPLVIATSSPLGKDQLKIILSSFVVAVLVFSLYSGYLIFGFDGKPFHTMEELSPIIWHIRWALMADVAVFLIAWLLLNVNITLVRIFYVTAGLWLIVYLFLFKSLTGIVVLVVTAAIMLLWFALRQKQLMLKWFTITGFLTLVLVIATYLTHAYARFSAFEKIDFTKLDKYTAQGNPYWNDTTRTYVENGHYEFIYICDKELRESWKQRSKMDLDGKTKDGGELKYALVRYLTSKGLRKDAQGVDQLTDREIRYIEAGKTNYIDTNKYALYPRLYISMLELYQYTHGANPTGYSLSQRIEYLKTSFHIIKDNFWFGIGTGDVPNAFERQYIIDKSQLAKNSQWWATNQLVTFFVNFGLIGFLITLFSLLSPPYFERKYSNYLFLIIFIIGFLSFLDEDTFETHPGISMFAFFYSLFLYYKDEKT